jgi:hypothetical protein
MDQVTPEVLRMLERQMIVAGGILAIFLGYRLFRLAHVSEDSSGKIKTKLFEFTASKVGPGVFFAAFGAWVLYSAMTTRIDISTSTQPQVRASALDPQALARLNALLQKLPTDEDRQAVNVLLRKYTIVPAAQSTTRRVLID